MARILVVGCASFDTIHLQFEGATAQTHRTIGGAGLYTALAAAAAGATTTLYAPKPDPMPEMFRSVENRVDWIGPKVSHAGMPTLEIIHHGGGRATLVSALWGGEQLLSPADDLLREAVANSQIVHIAALSSPGRQQQFFDVMKNYNQTELRISVGTYAKAIMAEKDIVFHLLTRADFFFMNQRESELLFYNKKIEARPGQIIFVTAGESGATVHTAGLAKFLESEPVQELDPTGAGDTFCGATLAGIVRGENVESAAQLAMHLAAQVIQLPGPRALLSCGK